MWKDAYLESRVLAADPIELVHILYEHTLEMVQDARRHLAAKDISARGNAISRALAALTELDSSLNRESGGSLSQNLGELYQYMSSRLLTANLQQQDAPLAEVENLLKTLGEAWSGIHHGATPEPPARTAVATSWGGPFSAEPQFAGQGWSA